ncbi:MAG: class I SAM-dependent methyltransferase [Anaerolineae bacterium]|nr:class I SAM-dependent methyltransferase [Anaerolineae bacterium]
MPKPEPRPRICDYEGSNYRTEFWEGKGRNYEDLVERIALRRLLPSQGRRLLEVGAGFGRLTSEYDAYDQVVLMDYSFSQLRYAQDQLGTDDRYVYVAADAYHLPFRPGVFDGATIIRVIHHMADVESVLGQVRRSLIPGGVLILEYANKRNLKAMYRFSRGLQSWNPYDLDPVEFVELNFDFHPGYMRLKLEEAGFAMKRSMPVSFFRVGALKDRVPTGFLAGLDGLLQLTGLHYTPSVFTKNIAVGNSPNNINHLSLFVCPSCGEELTRIGNTMMCKACNQRWAIRDGIYDFKAPLED